jgi:sugar/nucleoside kinase (ribokinase family)
MMDVSAVIDSEIAFGGDTSASISSQGGGAAANVATWLAFNKQSVYFVARVGDDQPGEFLLAELDKYGVAHPNKKYPDQKTGTVVVIIHDSGERTMFPDSGANSGLSKSDLPPLVGIDAVFISGYALINPKSRNNAFEIMQSIHSAGIPIVLDPGTVGALRSVPSSQINEWLALSDILILNQEEAHFIANDDELEGALIKLAKLTPLVVVKQGSKGSTAIYDRVMISEVPALPIDAVDTTGAGDAFAAGFMAKWFENEDLDEAIKYGAESARICIQKVGARPPLVAIPKE